MVGYATDMDHHQHLHHNLYVYHHHYLSIAEFCQNSDGLSSYSFHASHFPSPHLLISISALLSTSSLLKSSLSIIWSFSSGTLAFLYCPPKSISLIYVRRTYPCSACSLVQSTLAPGPSRPLKVLARIAVVKGVQEWKFTGSLSFDDWMNIDWIIMSADWIVLGPASRVLHSGAWAGTATWPRHLGYLQHT